MHTADEYGLQESAEATAARALLSSIIKIGTKEQQRLVDYCVRNIPRDRYAPMSQIKFVTWPAGENLQSTIHDPLRILYHRDGKNEPAAVHRHALGQLCDISGLHRTYASKLNEPSDGAWKRDLLAYNLNTLISKQNFINRKKQPAKFLHRLVGDELRAVLTQSYNRHLVSAAVLQPFLDVAAEVGLQAVRATTTDMRVHLQMYLPYAFEPIPGEFVAIGTAWSNSDFGQGKLKISQNVMRITAGAPDLVTEDAFSRMHLSSVVEDTDLQLDDKVAVAELQAVAAATASAVRETMKPAQVQKLLDGIKQAHEEKVPWHQLKNVLSKFLGKEEVHSVEMLLVDKVEDLPAPGFDSSGRPLASRWWAAAALARLSDKQTDPTRAMELKAAAGTFLAPADAKDKGTT